MSLSGILGRVIELCDVGGSLDTNRAVQTALPMAVADAEVRDQLLCEALGKHIKARATALSRGSAEDQRQHSFFGDKLRQRYALDTDGRVIKDTDSLTRLEFNRLIAIREKQIVDDTAHLAIMLEARVALAPIWDARPEYTYGQAERAYLKARVAA